MGPSTGAEALAALRAGLADVEHGAGPLEVEDLAEEALRVTDGAQLSDLTLPVAQRKILEAWRARTLEDRKFKGPFAGGGEEGRGRG